MAGTRGRSVGGSGARPSRRPAAGATVPREGGVSPRRSVARGRNGGAGRRSSGARMGLMLTFVMVACALVAGLAYASIYLLRPHRGRGVAVRVTLPDAPTSETVALALYRANVIERPWMFSAWLTVTGTIEHARPGMIPLRDDLTPRAVLRAIASGGGLVRVTIPEGYNRFEIAARLAAQHVVGTSDAFVRETESPAALARNGLHGDTLEGYLFPDTYDFELGEGAGAAADRMVRTFRRRFSELRSRNPEGYVRATSGGLTERDVVTFASLVEEETGAAEDRPRVAAVFWNRLRDPMFNPRLLQTDPTIVYGCRVAHPPSCPETPAAQAHVTITRAMLDDADNPYNTYRHAGLPPGPITNPGVAAFEATLAPAAIHALYFVATGSGHSAFANTRAEHEANVQRFLRGRGGEAGVSP